MKYWKFFQILFIAIFCLVIYGRSLQNSFIWDDDYYLYKNSWVQRTDGLKTIWLTHKMPQYYPIVSTMFWLEHKLWGLDPFGYHFVNLILHILNAFLVFCVVQKLYSSLAFPVALLFAIHPIQVETVAWVTEHKNLLGLFFFLLTLLAYLRFDRSRKFKHYLETIVFFLWALLSKSITVCFVWVPILYKWWRDGKVTWREVKLSIPFVAIGLFGAIHTIYLELYRVGARGNTWNLTFLERFVLSGKILLFYIYKLCIPFKFMFFYPRWTINITEWWQWLFPLASILLLGFLFYYRHKIGRGALTLFLFYIISIFPALGFINVYPMRFSFVADHFSYLSTPFLLLLLCAGMRFLFDKLRIRFPLLMSGRYKIVTSSLLVIIVIYMGGKSMALTQSYKNAFVLWKDVIHKNPKAWIAYNNLSVAYNDISKYEEAIALLKKVIILNPNFAEAHYNLGNAYQAVGKREETIAAYKKAIEIEPNFAQAYINLATAYQAIGKREEAIALYKRAIALNPHLVETYYNLGNAYGAVGKHEEAIALYKRAIALNPNYVAAYNNLGAVYTAIGMKEEAVLSFKKAIEIDQNYAGTYKNLAVIYYLEKQYDFAIRYYDRAMELGYEADPNFLKLLEPYRQEKIH